MSERFGILLSNDEYIYLSEHTKLRQNFKDMIFENLSHQRVAVSFNKNSKYLLLDLLSDEIVAKGLDEKYDLNILGVIVESLLNKVLSASPTLEQ
jgi:hypothetical protein